MKAAMTLQFVIGHDFSIWPSFIEIGEMAFITTAWSSHGMLLTSQFCTIFREFGNLEN